VIGGVNNNQYFIQNVLNATCKPAVGAWIEIFLMNYWLIIDFVCFSLVLAIT
jgi:hypothetical protein